jgi:hypothetical protein
VGSNAVVSVAKLAQQERDKKLELAKKILEDSRKAPSEQKEGGFKRPTRKKVFF